MALFDPHPPTDRILTDAQWAHIAGEVMAAVGLAPRGDARAVRWVAVRHAPDHVHVVATMVRQDRRTAWISYDKRKAQAACRDLEERYGLYRVAPAGRGSRRWLSPAELNKAARLDATRRVNPAGDVVWYGGGRLAPDLTLPQLRSRGTGTPAPAGGTNAARLAATGFIPLGVSRLAAATVRDAAAAMAAAPSAGLASAIAYAAADLLTATARAWEGRNGGPLTEAAEWFDRACHDLRGRMPSRRVWQAGHLRAMARLIAVMGVVSRDQDTAAALHLIYTLAALAETLADLREAQGRLHQARAARHAAGQLRHYRPPTAPAAPRTTGARSARQLGPDPLPTQRRGRQR